MTGEKPFLILMSINNFLLFNKTIIDIFENFIPHETTTCKDKDPRWMTKQIETLIAEKTLSINAWSEEC